MEFGPRAVRSAGAAGMPSSMLDTVVMAMSHMGWAVQGCLLPVVAILVFRMKEVQRLFAR